MSVIFYFLGLFACLFLVFVFGFYYIWTICFGVPYVPSDALIVSDIIKFLQSNKINGKSLSELNIAELGAGTGTLAFALAKYGAKVKAVEINPILTIIMRVIKILKRAKTVEILNTDLKKIDYSEFDCIVIYLYPELLEKIEDRVFSELHKGSYILSNTFSFKKHKEYLKIGKLNVYKVE